MFGVFRVAKARAACLKALQPFVTRPSFRGPWPPEFWSDPFVLGFIAYVIGTVSNGITKGKLSTVQKGRVVMGVLKDVGAPPEFMDRVGAFTQARHPDFMQAGENAAKLMAYIIFQEPMPGDPDVEAATELARGTTLTGRVDRAEIGGALMHMLFTQVVEGRLGK